MFATWTKEGLKKYLNRFENTSCPFRQGWRYETDAERELSILIAAELRDQIEAYQESCRTRYDEPKRDNVALNQWWDGISDERKQQLEEEIEKDREVANAWLKKNESKLPDPDEEGRDSHAELYAEFYQKNPEPLEREDRDGASYAEESLKEPKETPSSRLKQEEATEVDDPEESTLGDVASEYRAASELSSGPLSSSWAKVEDTLSCGLYGKPMTYDQDMRLRAGGFTKPPSRRLKELAKRKRVPTPKYLQHAATRNVWDHVMGEFRDYLFYEFNPHIHTLDLMSHKTKHKSPIDFNKHTVVDAEMLMGENRHGFRYLTPDLRDLEQWSGNQNDPAFQAWLDSGDYDGRVIALCGYGWPHHPRLRRNDPHFRIIIPPHDTLTVPLRGTCFAPTKEYFRDRRRGPLVLPSLGTIERRKNSSH